jgi:hypothetical protein
LANYLDDEYDTWKAYRPVVDRFGIRTNIFVDLSIFFPVIAERRRRGIPNSNS